MIAQALIGMRFSRWTVIGDALSRRTAQNTFRYVRCRCDCGTTRDVAAANLTSGRSQSCGCLSAEVASITNSTHGMSLTRTFRIWKNMRRRCADPSNNEFHRYGGRGIKVCDRWKSFEHFVADMGECPAGRSIDRIDNDGDYEPGNCRWATMIEQQRNRRNTVRLCIDGVTKPLVEWADEVGVSRHAARRRVTRGWSHKEAIFGRAA